MDSSCSPGGTTGTAPQTGAWPPCGTTRRPTCRSGFSSIPPPAWPPSSWPGARRNWSTIPGSRPPKRPIWSPTWRPRGRPCPRRRGTARSPTTGEERPCRPGLVNRCLVRRPTVCAPGYHLIEVLSDQLALAIAHLLEVPGQVFLAKRLRRQVQVLDLVHLGVGRRRLRIRFLTSGRAVERLEWIAHPRLAG